jgi:hypothetical protein
MSRFIFKRRPAALLALAAGLALGAGQQPQKSPNAAEVTGPSAVKYTLSGPFTHENLTIFLVHGEDRSGGRTYLTLAEALAQKKVIVHETKQVNELAVENFSDNEEVFVQSGDILKGGQQDRIIAYDLIIPPKSGRMPLASFCVEAGRWTGRGHESAGSFSNDGGVLPTQGLKIAARKGMQGEVWLKVDTAQKQLAGNLGVNVLAGASPTSLQLTLENKKLQETTSAFVKKLTPIVEGKADVIGYVSVVDGKIMSADVYASHALFMKLWPSLLNSSAVEAVATTEKGKKFTPVKSEQVIAFLAEMEKGKATAKDLTRRVRLVEKETNAGLLFECLDLSGESAVPLRRNYLHH